MKDRASLKKIKNDKNNLRKFCEIGKEIRNVKETTILEESKAFLSNIWNHRK